MTAARERARANFDAWSTEQFGYVREWMWDEDFGQAFLAGYQAGLNAAVEVARVAGMLEDFACLQPTSLALSKQREYSADAIRALLPGPEGG